VAPRISVVVATSRHRAGALESCLAGYRAQGGNLELIPVAAGAQEAAWAAGAARATGEYLHLTSDELEPHPGWLEAALGACAADCFPAAVIYRLDGSVESPEGALVDWRPVAAVGPAFLPQRVWRTMIDRFDLGMLPFERWPAVAYGPTRHELVLRLRYAFTRLS
jgi:hypothetical protein